MSEGLRTALAKEYDEWQRLGRGGLVWDRPVLPEPYFHPFLGHGAFLALPAPAAADDGRKDHAVVRLAKALLGGPKRPPAVPPPFPPAFLEPLRTGLSPDYLADTRENLVTLRWLLPEGIEWSPKDWEPLLYSLSSAAHPVCLEITASGGELVLDWVVERDDREIALDAMAAIGVGAVEREDRLMRWIAEHQGAPLFAAEFTLDGDFLFPLRSDFRSDPYESVLSAMARADPADMVVLQVVFSPTTNAWAEGVWASVTLDNGQPFFEGQHSYLQAARRKCAQPLFAASVRLAAFIADPEKSSTSPEQLIRSLGRFDGENRLVPGPPAFDDDTALDLLLMRAFQRSGMLLNAAELFGLVHPPSDGVGGEALRRIDSSSRRAPAEHAHGRGLLLGTNEHAGQESECRLDAPARMRHMHVLGGSGTGKSTFLLNCILQDLRSGAGVAVLDPHGDLVEAILDRLPESRVEDLVLFNPADEQWPVGFNILRAHSEVEKNLIASDFVAIFERLSSSWGDQMTAVLGNAALAILESDRGGTLVDLKRFLIEKGFRDRFLRTVRDPEVRYFWTHEFPLLRGTTQGSLLTRLSSFLRHKLVRNMVAQPGERFDVAGMMDAGKVILAPLSQGLIGQENSWLLGSLLVSKFYQAALSRQAQGEESRRPFHLYLDEAHNFVTPSIASILSGTRKYGLGLVLAHQDFDQFPSRESGILGSILSNCHTRVCFRLGDHDAAKLEGGFAHFEASDLRRLKVGEAICRIGGSDRDFNLRTREVPEIEEGSTELRRRAVKHSRGTYATPLEELERAAQELRDEGPPPPEEPSRRPRPKKPTAAFPAPEKPPATVPAAAPPPAAADCDSPPFEDPEPAVYDAEEAPPPQARPDRTPGRGGSRHKMIQQAIKQHGNGIGLRATIEAELPNKTGSVDVLLEGASLRIAFEVAERSPLEQEVRNIAKSIESGIGRIFVVSEDEKHLSAVEIAALRTLGGDAMGGVRFVAFSAMGDLFAELGAELASTETTSRGYKVRTKRSAVSDDEREERTNAIHRTVTGHRREGTARDPKPD